MADNKKYYYLKLKDNFFDSDAMIVLESMPDGYLYSNILLKLYLRSLKFKGRLMFNDRIPYNSTILAQVTRHSVGVIEKALKVFDELGLIEVMDNGAIYMLDIQNFIGTSNTEADRKRMYRKKIEEEKGQMSGQMSLNCPDKYPPEIEIEKDIDIDINNKDICTEPEVSVPEKMQAEKTIISLPLNDKTEHEVKEKEVETWKELYPAVNIEQELRNMKGWLISNPTKRKTKKGINRFINSWLSREQDKGYKQPPQQSSIYKKL